MHALAVAITGMVFLLPTFVSLGMVMVPARTIWLMYKFVDFMCNFTPDPENHKLKLKERYAPIDADLQTWANMHYLSLILARVIGTFMLMLMAYFWMDIAKMITE